MCVDVSKETLHDLVELILQHRSVLVRQQPGKSPSASSAATSAASTLCQGEDLGTTMGGGARGGCGFVEACELDAAVALSAVNVLTNQIFQLLRGATPAAVRAIAQAFCGGRVVFGMARSTYHARCRYTVRYLDLYRGIIASGLVEFVRSVQSAGSGVRALYKVLLDCSNVTARFSSRGPRLRSRGDLRWTKITVKQKGVVCHLYEVTATVTATHSAPVTKSNRDYFLLGLSVGKGRLLSPPPLAC